MVLGLGLMSACETLIEIDPPVYDSELNVISKFSPDSIWAARVMRTISIGDDANVDANYFLTDATVKVYQGDVLIDQLIHAGGDDGWYMSSKELTPQIDTPYRLVVEAPGLTSIFAEAKVPPAPILKNVTFDLDISDPVIDPFTGVPIIEIFDYRVNFGIENPPGLNYFNFSLYVGAIEEESSGFVIHSLFGTNMRYNSKQWYCYYSDVLNPLDLNTEIGSGAVCNTAILSDRSFNNQETLNFEIEAYPANFHFGQEDELTGGRTHLLLVVQSLSAEYVEYYSSLESQIYFEDFDEPANLYSNITGGHGIFAGYSASYRIFDLSTITR